MTGPIVPVAAAFGGEGHYCSTVPEGPPEEPPHLCTVSQIVPVPAAFSGGGELCTGCDWVPPPPPPEVCACTVGIGAAGQLSGTGLLTGLTGPYSLTFFEVTGSF